jgi:predicted DNA-binding transcriptional regulator AlpA
MMSEQSSVPAQYLRLPQAASYISMSPAFLRKEHRLGRGPERIRCGKCLLFSRCALDRWLAARTETPAPRQEGEDE